MLEKVVIGDATLYCGDALELLRGLPDESVQCCVTSPPYWGLRDYGVEGQLGLEATPQEYVARMVEIFREVRRLLRDDGTLWLNLGDSYGAGGGAQVLQTKNASHGLEGMRGAKSVPPKQLSGVPWRVAFALQADGWYLRQDCIEEVELYCPCGCGYVLEERIWRWSQDRDMIWRKPNPMPESVRDRCTKAHEYLFLLSKAPRYYFDQEAISEPLAPASVARLEQPGLPEQRGSDRVPGKTNGPMKAVGPRFGGAKYGDDDSPESRTKSGNEWTGSESGRRNRRSVWTVSTQPYKGAHLATFPPALVEPCVLAGCPEGSVVLDPFMGSGTTGEVSLKLGRKFAGIELSPAYFRELAIPRIEDAQRQGRLVP